MCGLVGTLIARLLFLFLWSYYPFRRRDGEVIALTMTIYPIMRFMLEIIRDDEGAIVNTGLTFSQAVSLLIVLAACGLWFYVSRQQRGSVWPPTTGHVD